MKKPKAPESVLLPIMMTELAITSWDTIARRTSLMMQGKCSQAEYQRMVSEKTEAAQASFLALTTPGRDGGMVAILAPWLRRTRANARRLRQS